jgi:hypothetical protein
VIGSEIMFNAGKNGGEYANFGGKRMRLMKKQVSEHCRRMALARWAKWRAEAANRPEPEPHMERWYPLEFGVRDKLSGETCWMDLRSGRDVLRRVAVMLRYYVPGLARSVVT